MALSLRRQQSHSCYKLLTISSGIGGFILRFLMFLLLLQSAVLANFKEHPANHSVPIGSDLSLRCSIALGATEQFHIQWRTNKGIILTMNQTQQYNEIPGYSGRYSFSSENEESLHLKIRNVTFEDAGQFQCQLLKPGNFLVASAFVEVLDASSPTIVSPSNSRVVKKSLRNDCTPANSFWLRLTLVCSFVVLLILFVVLLGVLLRMFLVMNKNKTWGRYVKNEEHNLNDLPTFDQQNHQQPSYTNLSPSIPF